MSPSQQEVTIPRQLFNSMIGATACRLADLLLQDQHYQLSRGVSDPVVHPGDDFGRVVAHLWRLDREGTMMFLADYMAELRDHNRDPLPITLNAILEGLARYAWPNWATDVEARELKEMALTRVSPYYGPDTTLMDS